MVTWHRPSWRRLKTQQEYNLAINPEELVSPRLTYRQQPNYSELEAQYSALDEGYLDLGIVKEITMGSRNHEYDSDLLAAGRRFGLTHIECCVSILYGTSISDNRVLCLLCPPMLCRLWYVGLNWIVKGIKRQQKLADRSMLWLKEQYIQLYFEDACCCEPLAADAIRAFGGRDWALTGTIASCLPSGETVDNIRREASIKFKKKRSVVNLLNQATGGGANNTGSGIGGNSCGSGFGGSGTTIGGSSSGSSGTPEPEPRDRDHIKVKQSIDRKKERIEINDQLWNNVKHNFRAGSITYETQLDFLDFIALFRSFG